MTAWVSSKERLPTHMQECLIYEAGHGCAGPILWDERMGKWIDLFGMPEGGLCYGPDVVTHWSPLPDASDAAPHLRGDK